MQRSLATTSVGGVLLIGAAMVMLGCDSNSSSGGPSAEIEKFVGIWQYDLSAVSQTCSDGSTSSVDLNGLQKEFFVGITSDIVDPSTSELFLTGPCDFRYDITAGVATIQAGQTCDILDSATGAKVASETPTTATFGLRGDGTELQEEWASMEASLDATFSCTTTIQGHLKKIAKD